MLERNRAVCREPSSAIPCFYEWKNSFVRKGIYLLFIISINQPFEMHDKALKILPNIRFDKLFAENAADYAFMAKSMFSA